MAIKDIIQKLRGIGMREAEDLPPDVAYDPHLRSLRRQRRRQLEDVEKRILEAQIKEFQRQKTRELIGLKKEIINKKKRQAQATYLSRAKL